MNRMGVFLRGQRYLKWKIVFQEPDTSGSILVDRRVSHDHDSMHNHVLCHLQKSFFVAEHLPGSMTADNCCCPEANHKRMHMFHSLKG